MSSSSFTQDNISSNQIAREHLSNFQQLPFHIYFTNPYSPLPPILTSLNFSNFFRQISVGIIPISPPPQRLRLVPTEFHYRYIVDQRPTTPPIIENNRQETSGNLSHSNSFSSLPDLIPISEHLENTTTSNIDQTSELLQTAPPSYSEPYDRPPNYHTIRSRELVLRRIRIIETDASNIRHQILEGHHQEISRLTSTTEQSLRTHDSNLREEIRILRETLDL